MFKGGSKLHQWFALCGFFYVLTQSRSTDERWNGESWPVLREALFWQDAQCGARYQLSPGHGGGTRVRVWPEMEVLTARGGRTVGAGLELHQRVALGISHWVGAPLQSECCVFGFSQPSSSWMLHMVLTALGVTWRP